MSPEPDNRRAEPAQAASPSRRRFLRLSALGATTVVVGATVGLSWPAAQDGIPDWTAVDIPDQRGRRVLVTGGNGFREDGRSGLGYEAALALARAGADVTIASRDQRRGEQAVRQILAEVPGATIRFETLDLASLASVRSFAARLNASAPGLDLLINNAGVMGRLQREISVDGHERVFATNTLGHFALTALLMPLLRRGTAPRVIWVSSMRTAGAVPFDDLQLERNYDYAAAYDNTKLANLMLAFEMGRRSKADGWGVTSLATHPGLARTNLIPQGPGLDSAEGWRFRMLPFIFQPASDGALPALYGATAPQAVGGSYYGPNAFGGTRGLPGLASIPPAAQDPITAALLWRVLEQLGQVAFG